MHITMYKKTQIEYYLDYIIEHCILAVAFFLPLSLNVCTVFLVVGALMWLGKSIVTHSMNFKRTPFDILIIILVLLSATSVLVSPDRGFSFYNYYNLMGRYILIYYLVINNVKSLEQVKKLFWTMMFSAGVVTLYGFYQYLFGVSLCNEWVDGEQFPDLKLRVFSTLENPNLLAGFLVTIMSIAAGVGYKIDSHKKKLILFTLIAIFGVCLMLTYSRGAWLSLLVVIGLYGFMCNRKIFWLLLLMPVLLFFVHDGVMERIMSIANPTDTSSTLRIALWESTLAMIVDKPILGIGWGAYWLVYPNYDFFIQNADVKIFHAHNMFLNIAAEIGIPGLITFLLIMYKHLALALSLYGKTIEPYLSGLLLGIAASIVGIIVNGFTDYIMFNIQLSMLFWLMIALVIIAKEHSQRNNTL